MSNQKTAVAVGERERIDSLLRKRVVVGIVATGNRNWTVNMVGIMTDTRLAFGRIDGHVVFDPPNDELSGWFSSKKISAA